MRRYDPTVPDAPSGVATDEPLPPTGRRRTWSWDLPDRPTVDLPVLLHVAQRRLAVGTRVDVSIGSECGPLGPEALFEGAGFSVVHSTPGDTTGTRAVRVRRERTLADSVGPGMRVLVCGVNPSLFSADAGVGYARPGNRFWPAALAAGIVDVDRDPVAALSRGLGMTDFVKRATRTAAEVTPPEYRAGFARVRALVEWLRPGAVCFVGLSGWRTVVDRHATAGLQPVAVGGTPAYVMPSTSGLNARTGLDELAGHLRAAWELGRRTHS
jgi:double-stranded uracil-DNA glycosylase